MILPQRLAEEAEGIGVLFPRLSVIDVRQCNREGGSPVVVIGFGASVLVVSFQYLIGIPMNYLRLGWGFK